MDWLDEASAKTEREREAGIARVRAQTAGLGGAFCVECDREIPPLRRKAMPSATRCIDCQEQREND
jgi:phage/conjugal plasmid C-4 type zinc finger TraR family protein